MERERLRAEAVLVVVALGWGLSFVVAKDALSRVSPHVLVGARFLLAAGVLAVLVRGELSGHGLRAAVGGLLAGAVLWVAFTLQTVGLVDSEPARAAFLTALYVPMTPLLARGILRQPLRAADGAAAALAFAGLALLAGPRALEGEVRPGDLLIVAAAVAFALHILVLDRMSRIAPGRLLGVLQLAACGLLGLPFVLAAGDFGWVLEPRAAGAVLFLGLVCTAFAYAAQSWAQRFTSASRTAVILALEAVFAALASVVLTSERLGASGWAGAALVLLALLVGQLGRSEGPPGALV